MPIMISRRRLDPGEFAAWQTRFIARAQQRKEAGCRGVRYYRGIEVKDEVVMIFDWETLEQGKAFFNTMMRQFPELEQGAGGAKVDCVFVEEFEPLPS
jgi:heme-degrading monooxygenase HmoA